MANPLRAVVGTPLAKVVQAEPLMEGVDWIIRGILDGVVVGVSHPVGNRIESNRSIAITNARRYAPATNVDLVMIDADAEPRTPLKQVLEICRRDQKVRDWDLIISPARKPIVFDGKMQGEPLAYPLEVGASLEYPQEVYYGSFSLVWISSKLLHAFEPLTDKSREASGVEIELFCERSPRKSEDADLCSRARHMGFHVGSDPRLRVDHFCGVPLPSVAPAKEIELEPVEEAS